MEKTKTTVKAFLDSLPDDRREDMKKLDAVITKAIPKAKKTMWEGIFWGGSEQRIIGYGDCVYINSAKKEVHWFIVGLALQKNYITVFVSAVQNGKYITEDFADKLASNNPGSKKIKVGKSTISFKSIDDINTKVLAELVTKSYELFNK